MKNDEWLRKKSRERVGFRAGNFGKIMEPINTLSRDGYCSEPALMRFPFKHVMQTESFYSLEMQPC